MNLNIRVVEDSEKVFEDTEQLLLAADIFTALFRNGPYHTYS